MAIKECQTACPTLWKSNANNILSRIVNAKNQKISFSHCCLHPCLANDVPSLHFRFERDKHCLVCSLMETLWCLAIDQKKFLSVLEEFVKDQKDFLELAAKEKYSLFWKSNPPSLKLVFKLLFYTNLIAMRQFENKTELLMSNKKSNSSTSENLPNDKNFQKPIARNTNPRFTMLSLNKSQFVLPATCSNTTNKCFINSHPFSLISRLLKRFWMWIIQLVWCLQELTNSDTYVNSSMNLELESQFQLQFYLSYSNSKQYQVKKIADFFNRATNLENP